MASENDPGDGEPETDPPEPDANDEGADGTEAPAPKQPNVEGLKKALAEERKWRKEHESIVKEAKDRAERDKSETQKLTDSVTAEKARADKAEAKLMRYEVAAEKGLPQKLIRFLTGDSKEELEEAADALLEELGGTDDGEKPAVRSRPKERLVAGKSSVGNDEGKTSAELAAQILDPL